ncbi:MAG TPA: serine hydrolase [Anaerolineae bacterium]|nr:serine hydrolase [Anaerolineae bacterium]
MSKFRGKKMLNWILWIALAAMGVAVVGVAVFLNQANRQKNALAEYIRANPAAAAIVAYTVDEQGQPVNDGSEVFYNADTPLVLASAMKSVILVAYEDAVERNELAPNEQVAIADLEKYYVPQTDGGAHKAGLAALGLAADADGFAQDQTAKISLDDIARIMIHNSGNAETDYLMARLGPERIAATMAAAGMEHHTPFHTILGITLAMFNHEGPLTDAAQRQALINAVAGGNFTTLEHLANLYLNDPDWRAAQIAFMKSEAFVAVAGEMGWDGQVESSLLFPKGTAREYAHLMAQIAGGRLISPAVSARIQQKLESAPADDPMRLLFHQRYGAKDGVTAGVLTLVSYAVPKRGALAGQTRVVVILTNGMPYATWSKLAQYQSLYLLQADLAKEAQSFAKAMAAQ